MSYDRPEEERNLASYFLSTLRQGHLFQILDDNIASEGNSKQLVAVTMLAKRCLYVRGEDRPFMKEIAMELEGLRLSAKHSWAQNESNTEEMESLISMELNTFSSVEGNSKGIVYDSMRNDIILPVGGGR